MRKREPIFIIAGIVLFIALARLTYGFYQLLRFFVCGVAAYGAFLSYRAGGKVWPWILGIIAVVFNPVIKFYFEKGTWQLIDIIAGLIFCIWFALGLKAEDAGTEYMGREK